MKIIKKVNPKFIHKCKYCKSIYEYSVEDIDYAWYKHIRCPVCENIDRTSIFDKKVKEE